MNKEMPALIADTDRQQSRLSVMNQCSGGGGGMSSSSNSSHRPLLEAISQRITCSSTLTNILSSNENLVYSPPHHQHLAPNTPGQQQQQQHPLESIMKSRSYSFSAVLHPSSANHTRRSTMHGGGGGISRRSHHHHTNTTHHRYAPYSSGTGGSSSPETLLTIQQQQPSTQQQQHNLHSSIPTRQQHQLGFSGSSRPIDTGTFLLSPESGSALMSILMNDYAWPLVNHHPLLHNNNHPPPHPHHHHHYHHYHHPPHPSLPSSCGGGAGGGVLKPHQSSSSTRNSPVASIHSSVSTSTRDEVDNCQWSQMLEYEDQPIQLAKKNLHPVQSRISEWLREIRGILTSHCPALLDSSVQLHVQIKLISALWPPLLLLILLENKLSFTVSSSRQQWKTATAAVAGNNNNNNNNALNATSSSPTTTTTTTTASIPPSPFSPSSFVDSFIDIPCKSFEKDLKKFIDDIHKLKPSKEAMAIVRSMLLSIHLYPNYFSVSLEDLTLSLTNIYYKDFSQLSKLLSVPMRLSRFSRARVTHLFCSHILASCGSVEKYILKPDE